MGELTLGIDGACELLDRLQSCHRWNVYPITEPYNRNRKSTAADVDSDDGDAEEPDPLSTPASSSTAAEQGSQEGVVEMMMLTSTRFANKLLHIPKNG
jgi:hypothetical protein